MSYLFPALRAKMGSTSYYQATVAARDLASIAKIAGELEEWKSWSIFERFQREIATRRVEREIVPYLIKTRDRFFGSLIVLVFKPDVFDFEPLAAMTSKLPKAYSAAADAMGFLTIDGGELVVLDGQHRLTALRSVVSAGDEIQGPYRDDVISDELSVIFVAHENFEKTRRIFNKVNRYAKPTSDSDNILTSEDDGYAIVTRWLVEDRPPLNLSSPAPPFSGYKDESGEPLVEWRSSQLNFRSERVTSLVTVYATVKTILAANRIHNFDEKHRVNRPDDRELKKAYQLAASWWNAFLCGFDIFHDARQYPEEIPTIRGYHTSKGLLLTPAGQQSFFRGLRDAHVRGVDLATAIARADRVEWRRSDPLWIGTIVKGNGAMRSNDSDIALAGRISSFRMCGGDWDQPEVDELRRDLRIAKDDESFRLPRAPR